MKRLTTFIITVISIAFSGCGSGISVEDVIKASDTLTSQFNKMNEVEKQYLPVMIIGDINDREKDSLLIWGTAQPLNGDRSSFGAISSDKENIMVYQPQQDGILGNFYSSPDPHYFLKKSSTKNAFGGTVPLWIYGSEPQELKDEKAKYEAAKENYIKTRRGYFTTVFKKIRKPPKKGDDPAIKRKALFGALAGLEKFDGMNLGDSIDENKVDIKTTATYGRIAIYPYPDKGVMVLVTGSKVVGFVYLIQANVIGDYFPFVKKLAFQNSFSSTPAIETLLHIPPDSLLKSQDEGKVDQTPMLLAELCDVRVNPSEHNPSGNTYIFCCRTDGNTTDILSATVINIDKSGVDIYVTPFSYAMFGHDPILGKDVYEMDLKITMESREQRAARVEEERFAKLQEKHPRLRTNLEEGLRNYQNGNYPWAYSELYEVLKADPENIAAQKVMNSIETHYETNRGTLSANDKDNFLNRLIQIASREEDEKRSITVYEKVLHFDPENRTAKNRIQDYETEQALRTRFIDNGDGTITDTQTQLMWTKKDSFLELNKGLNWEDSKKYVIELQTGGYSDWRMPTRDEAKSLFNHSFSNKSDTSEAYISPLFTKSFAYYCWTSETDDLDAYAFNTRLGDCWGSRRGDVGSCGVRAVRGLIESETSE